jgi:expansin (peptidoglycan-binding protein)
MIKTKIKKAIAIASIAALAATTLGSTFAADIGTASISGGATTNVVWDDLFPGTATGTVSGIVVTAQVLPTLNMVVSTGAIDLGILTA